MNKEEVLDFIDRVFFGLNTLVIQLSDITEKEQSYFKHDKLPDEYEEVRQYLKENLK